MCVRLSHDLTFSSAKRVCRIVRNRPVDLFHVVLTRPAPVIFLTRAVRSFSVGRFSRICQCKRKHTHLCNSDCYVLTCSTCDRNATFTSLMSCMTKPGVASTFRTFWYQFVWHEGGFLQHIFLAFHVVLWSLINTANFARFARIDVQNVRTCTFASFLLNLPVGPAPVKQIF